MRRHGLTLVELIVVISIVVFLIGVMLPVLSSARERPRTYPRMTQTRGIHSGLVLFAQGNNGYYPGLNAYGEPAISVNGDGPFTTANRLRELLDDNYFTGEYIISPSETKTAFTGEGNLTVDHYSYALLAIDGSGARRSEWRETTNAQAPIISDRAILNGSILQSVHTIAAGKNEPWRGNVAWNDNHVTFESTTRLDTSLDTSSFIDDHLFVAASPDDAAMTYNGTNDYID